MHFLTATLPLLSLVTTAANAFDFSQYAGKTTTSGRGSGDRAVPGRYFVEFDTSSGMEKAMASKRDGSLHEHMYRKFQARDVTYTVNREYDTQLLVGASIDVSAETDILLVAGMDGVLNVMPVEYVDAPKINSQGWRINTDDWPEFVGKAQVYSAERKSKRDNVAKRDNGKGNQGNGKGNGGPASAMTSSVTTSTSAVAASTPGVVSKSSLAGASTIVGSTTATSTAVSVPIAATTVSSSSAVSSTTAAVAFPVVSVVPFSANNISGVGKVHQEGNFGAGIKIGVIDSGVDYTAEPLGGCFGPGCKIAGGYDYVGDEFDGTNNLAPDSDPFDNCYGHGSFVAGIIGADLPNLYNVSGIAPQAEQYHYRIFSCYGATTNDIVAQAMLDAFEQGMDIINLSLGEGGSWTESMLGVLASRIADMGVPVVAAAGNEAQAGALYLNNPGTGIDAWSIGNVDNVVKPAQNATVSTRSQPITYLFSRPLVEGTFPLVAYTTDYPVSNDACPVPADSALDVENSVVLVQLSTECDMLTQAKNLYFAGVQTVLVIGLPGEELQYAPGYPLNYAQISAEDGQYLLSQLRTGANVSITFGFAPYALPNRFTPALPSTESAIGPTDDLYMKPQIMAPGGYIVSLAPTESGFGFNSGTSFSCPFVSASTALYMAAKGGRANTSPEGIFQALQATANLIPASVNDSRINTAAATGAGLLQIYDAIHQPFTLSPTELLLNDTAYFASTQSITIHNTGNSKVKFRLSHTPAVTVYAFEDGSYESAYPLPIAEGASANVKLGKTTINLKAGESETVSIKFSYPTNVKQQRLPIYSGYIVISSDDGATSQVPYLGVATAMKSIPILDYTSTLTGRPLPDIVDGNGTVQTGSQSYTLVEGDAPTVMYRFSAVPVLGNVYEADYLQRK
ncbi:hypothetical protein QFC19_004241 [Naganishia cerealis]|uniref:Uncharacterized protein n=1 Tax=Naganishia cerealis TaxID=610337 RepID=A0ACC2VXZ1_9TREE|nr:hypothetical protein QFC19_004241 [Naganishia cerealis]